MWDEEEPQPRAFWSSVTWPLWQGIKVLVLAPLGIFVVALLRREPTYGGLLYGAGAAAIALPFFAALWVCHRILKAWVEWPSGSRWVAALKAVVRFLVIGPGSDERSA